MKKTNNKKRTKKTLNPDMSPALAIASLVFGILSVFVGWFPIIGWAVSLLAIFLGVVVLRKKNISHGFAKAGIVLGAIGIVLAVTFIVFVELSDEGDDSLAQQDFFMVAANSCKEYTMQREESIGIIDYNTKNCTFTKSIVEIFENTSVKKYLEGTAVECLYSQGDFNSNWIQSLHLDLEECDGELREKLGVLLLYT
jgi:hypothetical protein